MIKRFYIFLSFIILSACCGTYSPRMKAGFIPRVNLVEIVYKGLDDKIFFAGPVKFEQENGKDIIAIDFTSEFIDKTSDSVTFRFTVINKIKYMAFSKIYIVDTDTLYTTKKFSLMFDEPQKKYFHHRYSFTTSYPVFQKMLDIRAPRLVLDSKYVFKATKHWHKDARIISSKISFITSGYL